MNSFALNRTDPYYRPVHQVKIFKSIESEAAALERQINSWLATENVRVINITGNIAPQSARPDDKSGAIGGPWAPSDVLIIVHYEKA